MPNYRLYILNSAGHFARVVELDADNDSAAVEAAMNHVGFSAMELWNGDRIIERFEARRQEA